MSTPILFAPYQLGPLTLSNRIVMAPMTRSRSLNNIPAELVATYYRQRASAGLIITEGTSPSPNGLGYARIPGLFKDTQVKGWKQVTSAVHEKGGHIYVQLMHTGRASHSANLPAGARVLAPSAITLPANIWVDGQGNLPATPPEAMTEEQIEATIDEYVQAARLAREADFDGVELHAANGYLINQFLDTSSNTRTDRWGGSQENRMRFLLTIIERSASVIGAERIGVRISPTGVFNGMTIADDPETLYENLVHQLNALKIAYLHFNIQFGKIPDEQQFAVRDKVRKAFQGTFIIAGGFQTLAQAESTLSSGSSDLIAFGRPFIANPDLVTRLRQSQPLTTGDPSTFYSPGEKGYTDYPAFQS